MKNLILIQHTQSVHHTNGMVGSWTDWELTELGREQALRIGTRLLGELSGKSYALYSSDLKRAAQTAQIVGNCLGIHPILRPELRERNLGRCCGKSVQWMREHMQMQERTVDDRMFSDGESRRDEWDRLLPLYREIMEGPDENVIVVSHGDLLSVFLSMFLGQRVEAMNDWEIFGLAGGVSFLQVTADGKRRIRKVSDLSYVKDR